MKKIYLLIFLFTATTYAQNPFVTTWEATSGDLDIIVPTNNSYSYDYTIDFGDGTVQNNVIGNASHTYAQAGIYTVTISGDFPSIYFNNNGDTDDILSVEQWGDIEWLTMEAAFYGCTNLVINASDAPDLSQVTSLSQMFRNASSFNQPINDWDVSSMTDMYYVFKNASSFNQPINDWNVSNVSIMRGLFQGAESFNQPLNNWDVSNVTNMSFMFDSAIIFDQPLNNWDVSNVTSMFWMFFNAQSFNQSLNNWDVSNVLEMGNMFSGAILFNQGISDWDFNSSVKFDDLPLDAGFLDFSGLDISNYDALLARFVQLGLQNKTLYSNNLYYCAEISRNTLINDLGWTILYDSLSADCELISPENTLVSIDIYPVPTGNSLYIKIPADTELKQVEIFNTQGKKVKTSSDNLQEINVENFMSGVYFIKLYANRETLVKKFIKL